MVAFNLAAAGRKNVARASQSVRMLPMLVLGMALSLFLVISYLICIATYFIPWLPISHAMLTLFLPGFVLLNWENFLLGLLESFAWGWFFALIFVPLYNFFVLRWM
jgi:hypothetical protein